MSLHVRPIALGAVLPLVLTALVATAAPAHAAQKIEIVIGASADGGDGAEQYLSDVAPPGTTEYDKALTAGRSGNHGAASGSASQRTSIGAMGITATASETVSASPENPDAETSALPQGSASAAYSHEGWVVPASGKWRITLSLRNEGTEGTCAGTVTGYVRFSQIARTPPIPEQMIGCNDGAEDHVVSSTLKAGETLDLSADMWIWTRKASHQSAGWTIKIEPIDVTPPPVVKVPVAAGPPVVSGTPKPGKTLSANAGRWRNDPTTFAFKWLRKGKAIKGAAAPTYKVKKADKGKRISVRVTAANSAGKATSTSKAVKIKKAKKKR